MVKSFTERKIQEELIHSKENLKKDKKLLKILESENINSNIVYVLDWIPEQAEDIYMILVNSSLVMKIEIERYGDRIEINTISVKDYAKKCSKIKKIKLNLALKTLGTS